LLTCDFLDAPVPVVVGVLRELAVLVDLGELVERVVGEAIYRISIAFIFTHALPTYHG